MWGIELTKPVAVLFHVVYLFNISPFPHHNILLVNIVYFALCHLNVTSTCFTFSEFIGMFPIVMYFPIDDYHIRTFLETIKTVQVLIDFRSWGKEKIKMNVTWKKYAHKLCNPVYELKKILNPQMGKIKLKTETET